MWQVACTPRDFAVGSIKSVSCAVWTKNAHCAPHQAKKLVVVVADKDVLHAAFAHLHFRGGYAGCTTLPMPAADVSAGGRTSAAV